MLSLLPLYIIVLVISGLFPFMILCEAYSDVIKQGYADKDDRNDIRVGLLGVLAAIVWPACLAVALVIAAIYGPYWAGKHVFTILRLAFGRAPEEVSDDETALADAS